MCVNGELIGTHGRAVEWVHPRLPHPLNRGWVGRKVPIWNCSQMVRLHVSIGANSNLWASYRMCRSPAQHVPQTEGLQIGDQRLNTLCGVVERPDHHRGDDLVKWGLLRMATKFSFAKLAQELYCQVRRQPNVITLGTCQRLHYGIYCAQHNA